MPLQPSLDYTPLLVANRDAPLELFTHRGIVGRKPGREARHADVSHRRQIATGGARNRRSCGLGVVVEVELGRSVSGRRLRRGRFLLYDDLGKLIPLAIYVSTPSVELSTAHDPQDCSRSGAGFTYGLGESTGLSALETRIGAAAADPEAACAEAAGFGVGAALLDFFDGVVAGSLVFAGETGDTADLSSSTTEGRGCGGGGGGGGSGAVAVSVVAIQDDSKSSAGGSQSS